MLIGAAAGILVVSSPANCAGRCRPANAAAPSSVIARSRAPATITVTPAPETGDVDPLGVVLATATRGTLTEVAMFNERGARIAGIMRPDNSAWKPGVALATAAPTP